MDDVARGEGTGRELALLGVEVQNICHAPTQHLQADDLVLLQVLDDVVRRRGRGQRQGDVAVLDQRGCALQELDLRRDQGRVVATDGREVRRRGGVHQRPVPAERLEGGLGIRGDYT